MDWTGEHLRRIYFVQAEPFRRNVIQMLHGCCFALTWGRRSCLMSKLANAGCPSRDLIWQSA